MEKMQKLNLRMQKLNLRMQNLNFPGTHWRGLALIGAQKTLWKGKPEQYVDDIMKGGHEARGRWL